MNDRACWTESGEHYFVKEPDYGWVCQVCGDVRAKPGRDVPAAAAGRGTTGGGT